MPGGEPFSVPCTDEVRALEEKFGVTFVPLPPSGTLKITETSPFAAQPQPGDVLLRKVENGYIIVAMPAEQGMTPRVYIAGEGDEEVMRVAKQAFVQTRLKPR